MSALEFFLHEERPDLPLLIKAGLVHVQFETIHPFLDGNSHLGRLLIAFLLCTAGVRDTAEQAAAAARRTLALFEEHRRKIEGLGRPAASVPRVFEHLQRNPIVSIRGAAGSIGISAPTLAKSLEHMMHLGLLREGTGRQRHRLFVYDAYLAILSEGRKPSGKHCRLQLRRRTPSPGKRR